jgi:glycosyltransferase involved in cell wall biosynthesis
MRRYDFSWKAVRQARRRKPDLLYVWPLQAAVAGLSMKQRVVLELHGPPEGRLGPGLFRLFLRLRGGKRICPITKALLDILQRDYQGRLPPGEVVIAPNGVDLERFADLPGARQARRELGIAGEFVAGYTGHLYPGRGLGLLTELARRHPLIQFLWTGGREGDVAYWASRLEREGIRNVRLTGFIDNSRLPVYQAAADVLLMPYEQVIEGSGGGNSAEYCSPMKMFEYMATGRAMISSDLPPLREVLDDQVAVLCPPEDPDAWSAALDSLASDPDGLERLGANARKRAESYTWIARQERVLGGLT